jgi:hypothetical protein
MKIVERKTLLVTRIKGRQIGLSLLIALFIVGCAERRSRGVKELAPTIDLGATIGSLARVSSPELISVAGYGLVGGLKGTGSSECQPRIRAYLSRYIQKQLPAHRALDIEKFISSLDTAVVLVEGIMPAVASKGQYFDLRVTALPGTQTTSLEGGRLFSTELKIAGSFGIATRILADAAGPVFIDKIVPSGINQRTGHILGGGRVLDDYNVTLMLNKPDFGITNSIRNRLNERFGSDAAKAVVAGRIELTIPAKYREQKQRFISIVQAMYLTQEPEITRERIKTFVRKLAVSQDKYASEIALEAIGNESLSKLGVLLNVSNEQVRLRAARCMLNLGSDAGLEALRQTALDEGSPYRVEALESITAGARRSDAAAISQRLLRDGDFRVRLAAYEQLRKLDNVAVTQVLVARNFYLERVTQTGHKEIFVSRSGQPRIVLFGVPLYCRGSIFVQSADGDITINAPTGQEYVTIIRKHPRRPSVIAQLKCSFEVSDIIRTLCEEPPKEGKKGRGGLGVSYADMIVLLKQMCDKGAVRAVFRAGPLPKIG